MVIKKEAYSKVSELVERLTEQLPLLKDLITTKHSRDRILLIHFLKPSAGM